MNGLALCSGIGGFCLGLKRAIRSYRTVCHVEREAFCAAVLAEQMGRWRLDPAPIWSDLRSFDGEPWRGVVDIVTAGFPCQPFSELGKRKGLDDDRWIWPDIARIIREVDPGVVMLENVPGLAHSGLGHVLGSLAESGFDAEWDCFRACDVGAPHYRPRLFVLAYARGKRLKLRLQCSEPNQKSGGESDRAGSRHDSLPPGPDRWDDRYQPGVESRTHGIPNRVDSVRAYGNAVVPAVVEMAFRQLSERLES